MNKQLQLIFLGFIISLNIYSQNTIEIDCEEVFLSGANIAWSHFARDIGYSSEPNYAEFNNYFSQIKAAGGNSARWWLHTTAQFTPEIEYSGNVPGLSITFTNEEIIDQIKSVLDIAWSNEIHVTISLFSFNLLERDRQGGMNFVGNKNFLESPINVQSYIDNALTPIVSALKDHPALLMWEIFNEAEGMSEEFGWTGSQGEVIPMSSIQMVVNKLAGAIHDADPDALVTNGSLFMLSNTDVDVGFNFAEEYQKNYYSDAELIAAGGVANGTLDLYQVHYYVGMPNTTSPLHNPASHWELDKPIMLGEFYAHEVQSIAIDNGYSEDGIFEYLYDNGYYGAWPWQWEDSYSITNIESQITHMQTEQPSVVNINTNGCPANTLDNDNDGVTNDLDLCLNTPEGDTVNSDGCSTNDLDDNDNDGIINGTDICPNTPNGESVDLNGCSINELNDDDNDGVLNSNDLCPFSPSNELVNSYGCSGSQLDNDQDGVTNNLDYCENTPIGEIVNLNGCTDNQIDQDQDGVIDGIDLCRNTPIGYSVDSDGCNNTGLSVEDMELFYRLVVYPNPTSEILNISSKIEVKKTIIFDFLGRKVLETTKSEQINVSELSKGIYLLNIYSEKGKTTKKIVIE